MDLEGVKAKDLEHVKAKAKTERDTVMQKATKYVQAERAITSDRISSIRKSTSTH